VIGTFALAIGAFIAAFAISTYEAWWTIALVVFGVIILTVERSSLARKDAARAAIGLVGSIVLGAAGAWMLLLSQFGKARPCDNCFDNGILFLPGLGTLVVAIALGVACLRSVARGFDATPGADSSRVTSDDAEREIGR
jgi:hypothetical protein